MGLKPHGGFEHWIGAWCVRVNLGAPSRKRGALSQASTQGRGRGSGSLQSLTQWRLQENSIGVETTQKLEAWEKKQIKGPFSCHLPQTKTMEMQILGIKSKLQGWPYPSWAHCCLHRASMRPQPLQEPPCPGAARTFLPPAAAQPGI